MKILFHDVNSVSQMILARIYVYLYFENTFN